MKKALIIASLAFLILTSLQIIKSFGVFETNYQEDNDLNIAKWHIYVNNSDLNNTANTFYIDNITYLNNAKVSADRFAPGVTGTFLIEIDPKDTEVSFKYDLSIDLSNMEYNQIKIDSIEGINGTNLVLENGIYSRIFKLTEIKNNKKDTIKVTFSWENNEENNETDSTLGSSDGNISIPVNIKFSQYIE